MIRIGFSAEEFQTLIGNSKTCMGCGTTDGVEMFQTLIGNSKTVRTEKAPQVFVEMFQTLIGNSKNGYRGRSNWEVHSSFKPS